MSEDTIRKLADWLSIIAGLMTIVGLPGIAIWSIKNRFQNISALRIYRVLLVVLKIGMICVYMIIISIIFYFVYAFLLVLFIGSLYGSDIFWDSDHTIAYLFSYFVVGCFYMFFGFMGSACLYTGSLNPIKIIKDNWKTIHFTIETTKFLPVEIIDAKYGANSTYKDVKSVLEELLTESKLKFTVGNQLFTDPLPNVVKEISIKN